MPYHAASVSPERKRLPGHRSSRQLPVSQVINDLEVLFVCSDMIEWESVIKHLPQDSQTSHRVLLKRRLLTNERAGSQAKVQRSL